jgi:hypothetical protein
VGGASIRIQNGSFYLDADLYDRHFGGLDAVAILRRAEQLVLLPLQHASNGGSLAKIRNARGDRVIHARELLRELAIGDSESYEVAVQWDPELAALTIALPSEREGTRPATGEVTRSMVVGSHVPEAG